MRIEEDLASISMIDLFEAMSTLEKEYNDVELILYVDGSGKVDTFKGKEVVRFEGFEDFCSFIKNMKQG